MDTSSTVFLLILNFFFTISTTKAAPGFFGLDIMLQGPRYDTHVELQKVTFLHFTRSQSGNGNDFTDVTEDFKGLNSSIPLVVILHGFMGSPHGKSTQLLIDAYVNRGGTNVVGVDWKDLAKGPWYGIAAERSYDAAKQTAKWMNELVMANVTSWKNIHVVGFSLGAQVAGLTSKYIPNGARVGRLTGLDPANPMFDEKDPEEHLDAEDSDFTTVVHTCGGFLAVTEPRGHVDFYPNGGENPQPPCTEDLLNNLLHKYVDSPTSMISSSERGPTKIFAGLVCSHYMALALWVESLKPEITFVAKKCHNWKNYLNNTCYNDVNEISEVEMGENVPDSTRGTYYFKTEVDVPYASTLNTLIADGIEEYSKILIAETTDVDHGHGEINEIKPEINVIIGSSTTPNSTKKETEYNDNEINRTDYHDSATSLRTSSTCVFISFLLLIVLQH